MYIKLSDLDPSIYSQIPLSIKLNNDIVEILDLPIEIQYIINKNLNPVDPSIYKVNNIYDVQFDINVYNDLKSIDSKKKAIIAYIKNYLLVSKGSYPFDPTFGNNLKKHLQTKDTSLRQKLLANELQSIVTVINESFNGDVQITDSSLIPYEYGSHTEYFLQIKVKVENEEATFTVR